MEAGSPKFNGSSPKSNGEIFGGTNVFFVYFEIVEQLKSHNTLGTAKIKEKKK